MDESYSVIQISFVTFGYITKSKFVLSTQIFKMKSYERKVNNSQL